MEGCCSSTNADDRRSLSWFQSCPTHYQVFGFASAHAFSQQQLKRAYRAAAKLYHPDVMQDSEEAVSIMALLNEAKTVLEDPKRRKEYDLGLGNISSVDAELRMDENGKESPFEELLRQQSEQRKQLQERLIQERESAKRMAEEAAVRKLREVREEQRRREAERRVAEQAVAYEAYLRQERQRAWLKEQELRQKEAREQEEKQRRGKELLWALWKEHCERCDGCSTCNVYREREERQP